MTSSRDFFELVKAIGECRSKQEEDRIIQQEMVSLKASLAAPNNDAKKLKEFLVRSIYVEMLGHDASNFAYIHGVNLSHNKDLTAKRVGYLVSCLFLDPNASELMILLINTIHKDLKSTNLLEVSFALVAVSRLANPEMVPALLSQVSKLLEHPSEMIRRRAVGAFHRLVQIGGEISGQQIHIAMRKSLCDSDPGVMAVGLNLLQDLVLLEDVAACQDLVPCLVGILKQVIENRLPKDFEYHRMPAPWIQIRLVSILSCLGRNNEKASELIYEVLRDTMQRADAGSNVGAAVVAECIKCAASIVPSHTLLEFCSHMMVSKFIASENHNFKYLGVTSMSLLAKVNVAYVSEHQMLVVECLEDSDDTLRRKTIELLSEMTNPANVVVVVEKLLSQLQEKELDDSHFKTDLVDRICSLSERFAPSNEWYLVTINQLHVLAGLESAIPDSIGENLTRLVAETDETDALPSGTADLREIAANEYISWIEKYVSGSVLSDQFLRLAVWMTGEFAPLCTLEGYTGVDDVIDLVIDAAGRSSPEVITCIITAASKLAVSASQVSKSSIQLFLKKLQTQYPLSTDIPRRSSECLFILSQPVEVQRLLLPFDAACEEIEIDLSFLDGFCNAARQNGAKEYSKRPPVINKLISENPSSASSALKGLRFEAYLPPPPVVNKPLLISPPLSTPSSPSIAKPVVISPPSSVAGPPKLNVAGARRWGPSSTVVPPVVAAPYSAEIKSEPKVVPPTVQNLEKQRMAAALFSGVTGSSPSLRYAARPKTSMASRAPAKVHGVDLLDLDASPSISAPPGNPDANLLDL